MAGVDGGEVITRGKIFISYRRDDDPGFALAVYQRLELEFAGENLFMDVEGQIKPGDDFVKVLNDWVAQCDVLLAIIGEGWVGARDADGNRRLEQESDFVRIEIASALTLGKRVIPVLVNKAEMPRADELPESLKLLARRNAVAIRPTRFKADSQGLVKSLKDALSAAESERAAKTEAERRAAEEERRRHEAEEEARAAQVEATAKARAQAGLTPEEIRKAEEIANWEFIKDSTNAAEFRDHLARFEGGTTDRYARKRLEALLWADPATRSSIAALRKFLEEFPKGDHAPQAQADLATLEREAKQARQAEEQKRAETEDWARVAASTVIADFEAFLKQWPNGSHAVDAEARIKELRGGLFSRRGVLKGFSVGAAVTAAGGAVLFGVWRHDQSIRTFVGHANAVNSVAFSPDGHTALSGSADKTLKLWDLATGKEIRTFTGHADLVNSVAFSPDGRTVLSGGYDTLKLWDVATGRELRSFGGLTSGINSVAFSPDGRTALSGGSDNTLRLWNIAIGKEIRTFTGHRERVSSVVFSPDGRTALSGSRAFVIWNTAKGILYPSDDNTIKLWDVATGKELKSFPVHTMSVFAVAFSPDGRTAFSCQAEPFSLLSALKLWDLSTGEELRSFLGHSNHVLSVAFSPDGRTALSGSWDTTLKLWDIATGKEIRTFTGHASGVPSVAFSPDGRTALSGSSDKTLKLWDLSPYLPAAR